MRINTKLILVLVMVLTAAVFLSGCSGVGQTVGVLDVNKVMSESPKIKKFQDQLNEKGKELSDQIEKDKPNLTTEEFQKRQETAYGEFLKTKQDLEAQIDASIKQVLDEVAKEKKLSVVLYKNGVAQGGTDITEEVLKKMQ